LKVSVGEFRGGCLGVKAGYDLGIVLSHCVNELN